MAVGQSGSSTVWAFGVVRLKHSRSRPAVRERGGEVRVVRVVVVVVEFVIVKRGGGGMREAGWGEHGGSRVRRRRRRKKGRRERERRSRIKGGWVEVMTRQLAISFPAKRDLQRRCPERKNGKEKQRYPDLPQKRKNTIRSARDFAPSGSHQIIHPTYLPYFTFTYLP